VHSRPDPFTLSGGGLLAVLRGNSHVAARSLQVI
jgi:hypothetical protein